MKTNISFINTARDKIQLVDQKLLPHKQEYVTCVNGNDVAKAIEFTIQEAALLESESGLLVGRSARANFVIEHDSVSRNHARFVLQNGALCLEDLDSMNGTWVDGQRLEANEPVPLKPGGIVEIGKIRLRVTGG